MVFSSLNFLYLFLPLVCVLYFIWKNRTWRNAVLLLASILFYAWGEPIYVVLILCATFIAYMGGILMEYYWKQSHHKAARWTMYLTVTVLVLNLVVFKYLGFLTKNLNTIPFISIPVVELTLPIGISFYTFQILSYVIDLYRREVGVQRNYFYLLLYVSFFPQLIAGPIVRYQTIEQEIYQRHETWDDVIVGTKRFILGLAKKVLLANQVALVAESIYSGSEAIYGTSAMWVAALAYTLQIYFDFSGYSDMAIGLGRIFGFHFLENFDHPYIACSVTQFWRRWHISLSTWFRDYVYIPLGGNRTSPGRWLRNILIVWMLTGIWHGAEWNFILWGLYYGVLLVLEKLFLGKLLSKVPKVFSWVYTFFIVMIGWVLFNQTDFSALGKCLRTMFIYTPTAWTKVFTTNMSVFIQMGYLPIGFICCFPWSLRRFTSKRDSTLYVLAETGLYFVLLILCIAFIVSSSYNPFIYFRF